MFGDDCCLNNGIIFPFCGPSSSLINFGVATCFFLQFKSLYPDGLEVVDDASESFSEEEEDEEELDDEHEEEEDVEEDEEDDEDLFFFRDDLLLRVFDVTCSFKVSLLELLE